MELKIGASKAKNCEELDFEVCLSVYPAKLDQKGGKRFSRPKIFADFFLLLAENGNDGDSLKRVLAKFGTDPSHVR